MRLIRIGILHAALCCLALPSAAATKIALEGEASPGSNGAFLEFATRGHLTETGNVVFFATTDASAPSGAAAAGCIFRFDLDGSNGAALLCVGEAVALPGGDYWTEVGTDLAVNGAGDLVFSGIYRDTGGVDQFSSFHLSSAGVLTDLGVLDGGLQLNDGGDVLVTGLDLRITSPGGGLTTILIEDQALPDDPSVFAADIFGVLGPAGEVAVSVRATPVPSGPPFSDWIVYLWEAGTFTRIGVDTFGPFTAQGIDTVVPHYTPGGRLLAFVDQGFAIQGVVEWDGAQWNVVLTARPGELIIGGETGLTSGGLSRIAGRGILDGSAASWCTLVDASPHAREQPLRAGDVLADGTVFQLGPLALSKTHWATVLQLDGAGGALGVYVGRANKVPSLDAPAAAVLVALLVLAGAAILRSGNRVRRDPAASC